MMIRVHFNLEITTCLINLAQDFCISKSTQGIIFARYRIPVNYGIAVETSVVYANSQFSSFLADEHDGLIVLKCARLYPAFLGIFAGAFAPLEILFHSLFADCGSI